MSYDAEKDLIERFSRITYRTNSSIRLLKQCPPRYRWELPELTINSKPLADVVDDFEEYKLQQISCHRHYQNKIDYILTYSLDISA